MPHILGVRHHGPGSARGVLNALEQLKPDIVLVEGPPDANPILPLLMDETMQPPVALLVYAEQNPSRAAYFPFALFSPEYQAIRFALQRQLPVGLIDLPQRYAFAMPPDESPTSPPIDPLGELARAAGYEDTERWWDATVEQRPTSTELFTAVLDAMITLREELESEPRRPLETLREAHMRHQIRQAQQEGFRQIVVVCGAWHAPALQNLHQAESDTALLSSLEEVSVAATWIPWTHSRLARQSGYGAGVESPGWYLHLWQTHDPREVAVKWLTAVTQHLRQHDLEASTAQIIDAVRLVETLTVMRGRALPDLHDLSEATLSVICHGNEAPMQIIWNDLVVGKVMGSVPNSVPMVPLQRDFHLEVARSGLVLSDEAIELTLDLRDEVPRNISRLLYRLDLLAIPWGTRQVIDFSTEVWVLTWEPGLATQLVEKNIWGNTILEASTAFALHQAQEMTTLPALTELIQTVLFADLSQAVAPVVQQLENKAALTGDIAQLMAALPPLTGVLCYGDVRHTQSEAVQRVVDGLITRVLIGLPSECVALDDEAATALLESIIACDVALHLLDNAAVLHDWYGTLERLIDQRNVHGLIRGRCCRIVLDADFIDQPAAVRQMRRALSQGSAPEEAADWLRGFLKDSGIILVHDDQLLKVVDEWVMTLAPDEFDRLLPLLRRTFATFEEPEIRHIGRRISGSPILPSPAASQIDAERVASMDETINELLGLDRKDPHDD